MKKDKMNIPRVLRLRRIELGISQQKLAEHCGFKHASAINRFESGQREWYMADLLRACEFLKLDLTISKQNVIIGL